MQTFNLVHRWMLVWLIGIALLIAVGEDVQAQYRKKVIILSGQEAPGTNGAIFDQHQYPLPICIADSGKVLFRAYLEVGVADVTMENNMGLWMYEGDSLRLLAREGSLVPGVPGMKFIKDSDLYLNGNMDRYGLISLDAFYSSDGTTTNMHHGFFIQEDSGLVQTVYEGLEVAAGAAVRDFTVQAFNNDRVNFSCFLEGDLVDPANFEAYCQYGPEGMTILARKGEPMRLLTGDWTNTHVSTRNPLMPLTADGETIFQVQGYSEDLWATIGAVYKWGPYSGYVLLRTSEINNPTKVFGEWRMDSRNYWMSVPLQQWPYVFGISDHNDNLVATYGDTATGTGGATFSSYAESFVAIDTMQVAFKARTSTYAFGIWMGDRFGLQKVVYRGDLAPGVPDSMCFDSIKRWRPNSRGQIAIADEVRNFSTGSDTSGIWMYDPVGGMDLVAYQGDSILIKPDSICTAQFFFLDANPIRSGVDGYSSILNTSGQLTYAVTFREGGYALLVASSGLVVNSTGDAPDTNTADGVCDTGGDPVNGKPECTLRAAIMEANAGPGGEKITSNIPPAETKSGAAPFNNPGKLSIQLNNPLPAIIKSNTTIDGSTQPGGITEVNGINVDGVVDGLTIRANNCKVNGYRIILFGGSGIRIEADSNAITGCQLGIDPSTFPNYDDYGNSMNGIVIKGSQNKIGGIGVESYNVIALNKEAGIRVDSGEGNTFRHNNIFRNDSLGIDLFPVGVHENDSLDSDQGANTQINIPIIDSAKILENSTSIYGTVFGAKNTTHIVDIYYTDDRDPSGAGEGKNPVYDKTVTTNEHGIVHFSMSTDKLPEGNFITATATDAADNTSEFSYCWPRKIIKLVDAKNDLIVNKEFVISKVANDRPVYSETELGRHLTDDEGKIDLAEYYLSGDLNAGDSIRVYRLLVSDSNERNTVSLDNAKYDSLNYKLRYDTLDAEPVQKVVLDHGIFGANIYIEIEWDAHPDYLNATEQSIRRLANYLYDVTDGQVQIDTAFILDNVSVSVLCTRWPGMLLTASNSRIPQWGRVIGYIYAGYMPRRWFGPGKEGRNLSLAKDWWNVDDHFHYRRFAQLLCHRLLGFDSESMFPNGAADPECDWKESMGFMGWPYGEGPTARAGASEMSWAKNYSDNPACTANAQYTNNKMSCWDYFEKQRERYYDGIFVPVTKPDERFLPPGASYFYGPNSNESDLDHDVGSKIIFPVVHEPRTHSDKFYRPNEGRTKNAKVLTSTLATDYSLPLYTKQGHTSDDGSIILLGVKKGDSVLVSGLSKRPIFDKGALEDTLSWHYVLAEITTDGDDTISFEPTPVYGDYPLVCGLDLSVNSVTISLQSAQLFQSMPTIDYQIDSTGLHNVTFDIIPTGYAATIPSGDGINLFLKVNAPDDSANTFFFTPDLIETALDSTVLANLIFSQSGDARFILDSINGISRAGVLSSAYPVISGSLNPKSIAVSDAFALGMFPSMTTLTGDNFLTIRYDGSFLSDTSDLFLNEGNVQIFYWNESSADWEYVGGVLDTALNEVTAPIEKAGVYAAYTTDIITDVDDDEGMPTLPDKFAVSQNYPNPFNPSTVISYSLPRRSEVTITVYNILGRRVRTLVEGSKPAGHHSVAWDGRDQAGGAVSSGVYFYRLTADGFMKSKKMILLK